MRYLQIKQISEASHILSQLEDENPNFSFILDTYSCKTTKKQKKEYDETKETLISHLLSTLNLSFVDYKFSNDEFNFKSLNECKKEALDFFNILSNDIGKSIVDSVFAVINSTVDLKRSEIFCYEKREGPFEKSVWFFCFLFYGKKEKRIILFVGMLNN
ncbi:RNA polymerase III-inhibiting protein maf1 [Gurleya vavrai]